MMPDSKIRPLYVEMRNFASFGNRKMRVEFPGPGESLLIVGSIGSGKSSIFHALFWCITGKKMSNNATVVNSVNQKNMYVECAWSVPWQEDPIVVRRGMKPAVFKVSGIQGTVQSELKKEFERTFPLTNPQVLLNLCLLSVLKSLPFFGLEKKQRLDFLRNFIDTERLDSLSDTAKDLHLTSKRDADILEREVRILREQLDNLESEISEAEKAVEKTVPTMTDDYRRKLDKALERCDLSQTRCEQDRVWYSDGTEYAEVEGLPDRTYLHPSEYRKILSTMQSVDVSTAERDKSKADRVVNTIETRISSAEEAIRAAEDDADGIESRDCKQYFIEIIEKNKAELGVLRSDLSVAMRAQADAQEKLTSLRSEADGYRASLTEAENALNQVYTETNAHLKKMRAAATADDRARAELARATASNNTLETLNKLRDNTKSTYDDKRKELAEKTRAVMVAKEYRKILDDTWGFMTARMVPYLNSRLPHYMSELGVDFSMQLDPRDISKPVFKGRPGIGDLKLHDLSTGQKRVLSICLAHSLRDMHTAQSATNIGFLLIDEVAGNMEADLVQELMDFEFRNAKETGSSLVLITHDVALQQRSEWTGIIKVSREVFSRIEKIK